MSGLQIVKSQGGSQGMEAGKAKGLWLWVCTWHQLISLSSSLGECEGLGFGGWGVGGCRCSEGCEIS